MLSSNRLVSAFKPWEPVCNNSHSVGNVVKNGESGSVKGSTEGIATVSVLLNVKDPNLNLNSNSIEDTTSCIDEQTSVVTTSMKRTKVTSLGSNNKHLKPSKKLKTGITLDDPSVSSAGKSKDLEKSRKGVELNRPLMNSSRKNGKLTGDDGDVEASPQGRIVALTVEKTSEVAEKGNGIKDVSPVVIGLQCKALTYSRIKKLQPDTPLAPETTNNVEGKGEDTNSAPKRKRGRPRIRPLKSPEASLAVNHQNGDDTVQGAGSVEGSKKDTGAGAESGKENPEVDLDNKSSGKLSVQQKGKKVKGRRGKRRRTISSINIEASPQDANGGLEKEAAVGNSELPAEKSIDTVSDDQPLSRWFEGMQSAATTVDSTVASKKPLEENLDILPNAADSGKLSFVKSSPLWETLESMEVFRKIPQKPHFRPLNGLKESAREGQAISQMVNFSKVVENTSRLRFESPRTAIEECLEELVELETHGFDVKLIRDRLTGLLLIKDKQEELEGRWKEVNDKIERKNVDRKEDDEEIQLLDKKIREMLDRRSQILSKKAKTGSEVGGLEVEGDGIKEGLNEMRRKFDCLAAASLWLPL